MRVKQASVAGTLVVVLAVAPGVARWAQSVAPVTRPAPKAAAARVGAIYFDGWAGPTSSFHFGGLLDSAFRGREPLFGWRDASVAAMRTQLAWAHQDGIGFFAFDWYYHPDPGNGPVNHAHDLYLSMRDPDGVGYALNYVNQPGFGVTPDEWPAVVEGWVTHDFTNPDYVRVDGKPLLIIVDEHLFNVQMGGAAGVNAAIATLQDAARRHGLPGVFVVGDLYLDYHSEQCFPDCLDTGRDLPFEHYDALSEFSYPQIVAPRDGPRPYVDVAAAIERTWSVIAQRSPLPHIPAVMAGLDARPMILAGQVQPAAQGGWPLLDGHRAWFTTSAADVARLVREGIKWVNAHPSMRVEAAPAPPLLLIESWNELQEGAILLATRQNGYSFGHALAGALGLPWHTVHTRHFASINVKRHVVSGVLAIDDQWSPCDLDRVAVQRRVASRWITVATTSTKLGGLFSVKLPKRAARYRVSVSRTIRYRQTCGAAASATQEVGGSHT